jgi:hypothetical protein
MKLQFSVRSLFVGVTFAAGASWFGHEASLAHEREALRKWIEQREGACTAYGRNPVSPSLLRGFFGDRPVSEVWVPFDITENEKRQIESAFPDAKLILGYDPPIIESTSATPTLAPHWSAGLGEIRELRSDKGR